MDIICLLKPIRYFALFEAIRIASLGIGDPTSKLEGRGATGTKMVPFESVLLVSYQLPLVTKVLSLTVFAQLSNVTDRRTAGWTDR